MPKGTAVRVHLIRAGRRRKSPHGGNRGEYRGCRSELHSYGDLKDLSVVSNRARGVTLDGDIDQVLGIRAETPRSR